MGGAPILFTLYKNGIAVNFGSPDFTTNPALMNRLKRAFDEGENVEPLLWDGDLAPLMRMVQSAVDSIDARDCRGETYVPPPPPPEAPGAGKKKRKKKR